MRKFFLYFLSVYSISSDHTKVRKVGRSPRPELQDLLDEVVQGEADEHDLGAHEEVVGGIVVLEQLHHLDVGGGNHSS
jgi:hypothetical protein